MTEMSQKIYLLCLALFVVCTRISGIESAADLNGAPIKVASGQILPKSLLNSVHPGDDSGFLAAPKPDYDEIDSRVTNVKNTPLSLPDSVKGYEHKSGNSDLDNTRLIPPSGFIASIPQNKITFNPSHQSADVPQPLNNLQQHPYAGTEGDTHHLDTASMLPNSDGHSDIQQSYPGSNEENSHTDSVAGNPSRVPNQVQEESNIPHQQADVNRPHSGTGMPHPDVAILNKNSPNRQSPDNAFGRKGIPKMPKSDRLSHKLPAKPVSVGPLNGGNSISIVSNQPGGNNRQCTFSISSDNEFQPSSDDFGYPKYQVEDAYEASLAKPIFDKFIDHKQSTGSASGLAPRVGLGGFNSIPGRLGGPHRTPNRPAPRDYGFDPSGNSIFNSENAIHNKFNNLENSAASPFGQSQFPGFRGNNAPFSRDVFNNNDLSSFHFRKRRMAGFEPLNFQSDVQDICPVVSKSVLKSFKKYGSTCFVWEPTKQNLNFVQCSKTKCRTCRSRNTSSKCMAEQVTSWVWAYCEQGPFAGQVALEKIKLPMYCTCKIYRC